MAWPILKGCCTDSSSYSCEKEQKLIDEAGYAICSGNGSSQTAKPMSSLSTNASPCTMQTPVRKLTSAAYYTPDKSLYAGESGMSTGPEPSAAASARVEPTCLKGQEKENMASTASSKLVRTPYFLRPSELAQKTCPTKPKHPSWSNLDGPYTPFRQRLLAAKRKSAEFVPRQGCQTKKMKGA